MRFSMVFMFLVAFLLCHVFLAFPVESCVLFCFSLLFCCFSLLPASCFLVAYCVPLFLALPFLLFSFFRAFDVSVGFARSLLYSH